ncbi:MAG TPA: SH3 domain-containing protein, partial [Caldilineaceae bacterium]|nr:SH3 domain-containing protein [Caldilineaceae bacterium]
MDRKLFRVRGATGDPHTLVMATPTPRRRWGVLVVAMALLAGMTAALVLLARPQLGSLELLPQEPTEEQEQTAQALTGTVTPPPTQLPMQRATAVAPGIVPFGSPLPPNIVMPSVEDLRNVDLRTVVAPPTATPTRTPVPPPESLDAVVGAGGALLWDEAGRQVARAQQGTLLTVDAQSADGRWLHAVTETGEAGWVAVDALIVFDAARLRRAEVVIIPITPTPAGAAAVAPGATAAETMPATPVALPNAPTARVVADGSRLNVRAGPGPGYPILAKAQPGETLVLLGQDATGDWLQVAAPVTGGFGWVSAEFVETEAALDELPVVTDVNDADPDAAPPPGDSGAQEMGMAPGGPARGGVPPQAGAMFQAGHGPILYPTATP